jgi:DNA repair protein RecN (Recombination protein N)
MLAGSQLEILDEHCGAAQVVLRTETADAHARVRELEAQAEELRALAGARERELDLLAFELEEIEAVAPSQDEQAELTRERDRLRNLETLRGAAAGAAEAISPETGPGVAEALAGATQLVEQAAAIDRDLAALADRLGALRFEAEDVGGELRRYLLEIEASPGRLEEVEERLGQFARLERKHGGSIADVLAHAEHCRARREQLEHAEVALEDVETELVAARGELERLAGELTDRRRAAAPGLAEAVRERLADLAMADAAFEVVVHPREGGIGARGADTVEFVIAPNPGLPTGPLKEIASGGELSRVMLALLSSAQGAPTAPGEELQGGKPLLVFDEIDAGVGGHTARAVGSHLRELARHRQILCITHLPQVAALAERHFTIVKDSSATPARTSVELLRGDGVVGELVRMLGAGDADRAARQHARQLLKAA